MHADLPTVGRAPRSPLSPAPLAVWVLPSGPGWLCPSSVSSGCTLAGAPRWDGTLSLCPHTWDGEHPRGCQALRVTSLGRPPRLQTCFPHPAPPTGPACPRGHRLLNCFSGQEGAGPLLTTSRASGWTHRLSAECDQRLAVLPLILHHGALTASLWPLAAPRSGPVSLDIRTPLSWPVSRGHRESPELACVPWTGVCHVFSSSLFSGITRCSRPALYPSALALGPEISQGLLPL